MFGKITPAQKKKLQWIRERVNEKRGNSFSTSYANRDMRMFRKIEEAGYIKIRNIRPALKTCEIETL